LEYILENQTRKSLKKKAENPKQNRKIKRSNTKYQKYITKQKERKRIRLFRDPFLPNK